MRSSKQDRLEFEFWEKSHAFDFTLFEKDKTPPGMVWVPGGSFNIDMPELDGLPEVTVAPYWIDKFEVTNRDFKKFVDAGGYTNRTLLEREIHQRWA